jgi:hypothetical protein
MNQPTREEFDRLEKEQRQLEEEVRKLKEQQTEPINVRVERGLPVPEATLLQTIMTMVGTQATDVALLKGEMQSVKADIKAIRESQADFRDTLQGIKATQDERFDKLERTQDLILQLLQKKDTES